MSHQKARGTQTLKDYFIHHRQRLFKYVSPIILFSICYYIPRFFEVVAVTKHNPECLESSNTTYNCSAQYSIEITDLRINGYYVLWYLNVSNLIVTCVIPVVSIVYLNYRVYSELKDFKKRQLSVVNRIRISTFSEKHKERNHKIQQTTTLFGIIIVFGLCHILRVILNIEELVNIENIPKEESKGCADPVAFWVLLTVPISQVLVQINCSVNLFIYCMLNKRFKDVLKSYAMECVKKYRCTSPSSVINIPTVNVDASNGEHNRLNS